MDSDIVVTFVGIDFRCNVFVTMTIFRIQKMEKFAIFFTDFMSILEMITAFYKYRQMTIQKSIHAR